MPISRGKIKKTLQVAAAGDKCGLLPPRSKVAIARDGGHLISERKHERIVCLDVGTKRIGVAASDPMGWTAQPVRVIERRGGERDFEEIRGILVELSAGLLLVGLPLDAEGELGPQAKKVQAFAEKLRAHLCGAGLDIPLEFQDERYSTATAEGRLIDADVSRARRRRVIDKMAAAVILSEYLEAHEPPAASDDEEAL